MKTLKELNALMSEEEELEERNARKFIDFLKEHKNEAYTREELRDIIGDFVPHSWRSGNWEIHWDGGYYWVERDLSGIFLITILIIIALLFLSMFK